MKQQIMDQKQAINLKLDFDLLIKNPDFVRGFSLSLFD